jgi:hypothetical protein
MSAQLSFPLTYRDDEARPTDSDDTTAVRHISEDLLNEMGRALADRLNALVEALDQQR